MLLFVLVLVLFVSVLVLLLSLFLLLLLYQRDIVHNPSPHALLFLRTLSQHNLPATAQMLELAKKGAVWLRDYEGWGAGTNAPVVEEGEEPPEMLRHLEHAGGDAREVGFRLVCGVLTTCRGKGAQ